VWLNSTCTNSTPDSDNLYLYIYGLYLLVIVEAPVLTYSVIYSESVELNCTVTYDPDLLNVTWIRATNPVSVVDMSNTARYTGSTISNPHLTIHNAVTADADKYYKQKFHSVWLDPIVVRIPNHRLAFEATC
jgi:hypothetical protein